MQIHDIARGDGLEDGETTRNYFNSILEAADGPLSISLRQRDKGLGLPMGLLQPRTPTKSNHIK